MARKSATVLAQGEYIMLLDSDDEYAPNACETVWNEEQANPVDILQFGTNIVFCNNPSEEERKNTIAYYKPYKSYFGDLVEASFQSRLWNHNIWNKAYNASAWKKAFPMHVKTILMFRRMNIYTFWLHITPIVIGDF